jgi:putative ABC transport system substrate-binding protein
MTLGYFEGQNIKIEYRWAEGNMARLPQLASELVEQKVDVILAGGSAGAEAAKHATSLIPIIAAGVGDLVELGLVTSLARPGGNLTGFVAGAPETAAKRFQIMKEIKPQARRAAVLWNPTSSNAKLEWETAKEFAVANDIVVVLHDGRNVEELQNELARIPQSDPDILIVLNDPFMFTSRKIIVDAAGRFRLPSIYGFREFVDDGGMLSYGVSITDTYRRAASYVEKVLRGTHPADLPVQLPTKFELIVNLKTAKAIGFALPDSFLLRADEVIE